MDSCVDQFKNWLRLCDNPSDPTLLMEYTSFLSSYEETMKDFEALEDEEMNDAELLYYIEVTGRIQSMLAEASIG